MLHLVFERALFNNNPQSYNSWTEFVQALYAALENKHEHTRHPLWIIYMLAEADVWLKYEAAEKDRRTTDSSESIERLHAAGQTRSTEIAKLIGKSRQYVTKVKKKKGLH